MHVLSRQEMYWFDKYTIEKIGIPGENLMENAGKGCFDYLISELIKPEHKILIICGNGNNGGDGMVIARYLKNANIETKIVLVGDPGKMSPETLKNYQSCLDLNISVQFANSREEWENLDVNRENFTLIVDALFGIGFKGEIIGWKTQIVDWINSGDSTVVAIDIPSGLDADTGNHGKVVKADFTLTMAALKYGHLLLPGRVACGVVKVIDLGFPENLFTSFPPRGRLVTENNVEFPSRSRFSHKGDYGRIGIIAGSPGYTGAAVMSCRAALRAGGGLIYLLYPVQRDLDLIYENKLTEVITISLPLDENGVINKKALNDKLENIDVLLLGPGIGQSQLSMDLVEYLLDCWKKPLVLDADALNIISRKPELLRLLEGRLLLPHIGEFARLVQKNSELIQKDLLPELMSFCQKHGCSVLLKSATSVFCDGHNLVFNTKGNDGLATGGSGDVLAGIVISFLGQKLATREAATAAAFLLGITAEKIALT
ncbi:MAG: NAD(P)H-hydrate dehydratase, partial [Candidatus Cloacimonetes bacterium]|nr:NAD(P)H-hydrate dehydratase [Candidatus Cloacimonadota bacterium]